MSRRPDKRSPKAGRTDKSGKTASRPYHHGDLRAALVRAAADLLEDTGPADVSLREVARRCGVSQAAPYRHFPSREGLLAAVATEGFLDFTRTLSTHAGRATDPQGRLKGLGLGYIAFAEERPQTFRLMFGMDCGGGDAELARVSRASYALLADTVADCLATIRQPAFDRATLTMTTWAQIHGIARLMIDMRGNPPDLAELDAGTRAERMIDLFIDGLLRPDREHHRGSRR